jgi:hypothetical protein
MTIPEVRKELMAIAIEMAQLSRQLIVLTERQEILVSQLKRRKGPDKSPITSRAMSPEVVALIHELHQKNPSLSQAQIALLANVNNGRVSETLRGKRS